MADVIFNSFKKDVVVGNIDLDTDTLYIMLVTSTYSPNQDTHAKRSDVTNEVSGTGYTTGGQALGSVTVTQDNTGNKAVLDAADAVWTTASITARAAVIYKHRGGASTADELVAYLDFGADVTSTAADFTVAFNASGILAFA